MPSQDFQDFMSSCFPSNFGEWHNGLNVSALLKLSGDELVLAERMILEGIPKTWHENHSVLCAGILRLVSASSLLKKQLKVAKIKRFIELLLFPVYIFRYEKHHERIAKLAWTLYQIEKYRDSGKIITSEIEYSRWLSRQVPSFFQIEAFWLLTSFGGCPEVLNYLNGCLQNKYFAFEAMCILEAINTGYSSHYLIPYQALSQIREQAKVKLVNLKSFEWASRG